MLSENKLYTPLAVPEEIARWDAEAASDYALPTLLLMENAAREALYVLDKEYGLQEAGEAGEPALAEGRALGLSVLVLAGGGNNGGDGISLARHLLNRGCRVLVYTSASPGKYKGVARSHLIMARKAGVRVEKARMRKGQLLLPADWQGNGHSGAAENAGRAGGASASGSVPVTVPGSVPGSVQSQEGARARQAFRPGIIPDIVVDALVGAGFKAPLRGAVLDLVRAINDLSAKGSYVFSLDIPSGLDALEGLPSPEAVRAKATVSFAAAKPGLCLPQAGPYTGRLHVREIGLPAPLMRRDAPAYRLVAPQPGVLPKQSLFVHKNAKGRVLIIGGSPGLTGAPALAALGAARAGSGLVTVAAPAALCREIKGDCPEIMTLPLGPGPKPALGQASAQSPSHSGADWQEEYFAPIAEFIGQMGENSALVLGPGLGRSHAAARLALRVIQMEKRPRLVLDADGLFFCRLRPQTGPGPQSEGPIFPISALKGDDVLTPHAGEMLRLLENHPDLPEDAFGRLRDLLPRSRCLNLFRSESPAAILLKGAGTLVAQGSSPLALIPFAEPNLAVGGSGDILAGIIAALLARGGMPGDIRIPSLQAAALGAYLHARAGAMSRIKFPYGGNLASDLAALIPAALKEVS